jgi:lysophospholipase L1-like esterase
MTAIASITWIPRTLAALAGFLMPALLPVLLPPAAAAQPTYIAFGDSITFGYHDDPNRAQPGYPPRLQALLEQRGQSAVVVNAGLNGESTAEGVSRLPGVLAHNPATALLLMEGTNDINARVSLETITFNLDEMAKQAEAAGLTVVHATIIPRLPTANFDGDNHLTGELAAMIRELAATADRGLADPFEVLFYDTPDVFSLDYFGGSDKLHPNSAGYDRLAGIFADVLSGVDSVSPVPGAFSPADGATEVPADGPIDIVLYDFGAGIDLTNTKLVIDGQPIADTPLAGTARRVEILYTPATPFTGLVHVGVHAPDLATPANVLDRELAEFTVAGAHFLPGDLNRDGRVDGDDLVAFALAFGARRGDPRFNPMADLNGDGTIDGDDLAILAANFGQSG